jgi:hypothetical protein
MALPIAIETERTLYLRSIVDAEIGADNNVFDWPQRPVIELADHNERW